jgi:DNA-binding response OmpR family regulator
MTGPLILIIEDNLDLRTYISSRLAKEYQVLSAENGRVGLDLAMEHIPDLVISDLMMPEMDGIDVCRRIRESEKTSHIPMILLTAKADRESKLEGLETGADEYMIKPFDVEELRIRVKNLIEQRKRLREQFKRQFASTPGSQVSLSSNDALLQKILSIIEQHLPDADFTMASMARELNISRSHLFRKVSAVTGYTPNDLLRIMRMKKAAMLFDSGETNVSRVMYEVGYNNPSYFSRCFREVHGINPSRYIKRKR